MPARILIVEDNPNNMELMAYILRTFGHEVTSATNGVDGLVAARRGPLDLIIADILMPEMDGFEFVRRIRTDPSTKSLRVVAITALAMAGDRERILSSGFDGYIAKPIEPKSFVAGIDAYLAENVRSAVAIAHEPSTVELVAAAPSGKTVLVVDDVPANIRVIEAAFAGSGHRVVSASSAREALAYAAVETPDVVISDIHMPDGDGFGLIRAFKADRNLAGVPFVFLSSTYWHDIDKARGNALGASKFLTRPIEPAVLLAEVQELLDGGPDG